MSPDTAIELEFEFSLKPSELESFSGFLIDFHGRAFVIDEHADMQEVARLNGHRLDLSIARQYFEQLQELLDCISAEMADLGHHILRDNQCFIECCSRNESERTPCGSLVFIGELWVEAAFRNQGIGQEMLKRMSQIIDLNQTLVALKAYPIVDEQSTCTPELMQRLKGFYHRLGFRRSGEHFMVKDARDCHTQRHRAAGEVNAAIVQKLR